MSTLPDDIRNLPTYTVSDQLFACTIVAMIVLTVFTMMVAVVWIIRSCKHIYNYQYIANIEFLVYQKNKADKIRNEDEEVIISEHRSSQSSQYSVTTETKYKEWNRNESRFLEFSCLSVVLAIHINAFACNAFELIVFMVALALFLVFNVIWRPEGREWLRLLFLVALFVAYIPFFVEDKRLETS